MASATAHALKRPDLYTYADYLELPDDGNRYEILDGELFMAPAPTLDHQRTVRRILVTIDVFLQNHPLGEVFPAPTDVVFSDINVMQPDLLFVSREKFAILTRENIQGAPDLVIEVLSPGTEKRDRTGKLHKYGEFGVQEYWMASEERQTVEVWRRQGEELVFHALLDRKKTLTTPLLPGLKIELEKIFARR